ncbi:hypothetical protein SUGI_0132350 [Cryptomeria japonica]|nr:hypothetical protein SUGI_0132350 [Cryptomeria japonica]
MTVHNTGRESLGSSWSNAVNFDNTLMNSADLSYLNGSDKKPGFSDDDDWSEELRGNFYERYMEKRDAKLWEESLTKQVEKEAKLKAMQEALELTKAGMVAMNAKSLEKQDSIIQSRARAEKLKPFNAQSLKNKKQQSSETDAADTSKRELLRAIDVRLIALQQESSMGFARAFADGFAIEHMADLIVFADRLKDVCAKFMILCQKRHVVYQWRNDADTQSSDSDMSIENGTDTQSSDSDMFIENDTDTQPSDSDMSIENGTEGELMLDSSSCFLVKTGETPYGHLSDTRAAGGNFVDERQTLASPAQLGNKPLHSRVQSVDHFEAISSAGWVNLTNCRGSLPSTKNLSTEADTMNKSITKKSLESSRMVLDKCKQAEDEVKESLARSRSEVYVTASENSVHTSSSEKDQGQIRESPPESTLGCSDNEQGTLEGKQNAKWRLSSLPRARGHQRPWSSASDYSECFSDNQTTKFGSITSEEQAANIAKKTAPATQFKVQLALNSQSSKTAGQGSDVTHGSMNTKQTASPCGSKIAKSRVDPGQIRAARQGSDLDNGSFDSKHHEVSMQRLDKIYGSMDTNQPGSGGQGSDIADSSMNANRLGIEVHREGLELINCSTGMRSSRGEEPLAKVKQSRGNQELNKEPWEKADQLEPIFTAHKLWSQAAFGHPEDTYITRKKSSSLAVKFETSTTQQQMSTSPRESKLETSKSTSGVSDRTVHNIRRESLGSSWRNAVDFDNTLMNSADLSYLNSSGEKTGLNNDGWSEELRGKFYERYMEKRHAKLQEESIIKRAQSKAKLKAMKEALESTKAQMVAWNAKSLKKQDSIIQSRARAEKLRSFNAQSSKNKKQQFEAQQINDEEYSNDVNERAFYKQPRSSIPVKVSSVGSASSAWRRVHENPLSQSVPNLAALRKENKKPSTGQAGLSSNMGGDTSSLSDVLSPLSSIDLLSSNKSMPYPAQRGSLTSPSPKSSIPVKVPSVGSASSAYRSGRENPLAQSVPNFADLRKENTKPSTGRVGLSSNLGGTCRGQPKRGSCKSLCFFSVQSLRSSIPAPSANFKLR